MILTLFSVIAFIIGFFLLGLTKDDRGNSRYEPNKKQVKAFILPICMLLFFGCFHFVPVNSVGIQYSPLSGVSEQVLSEGLKFKTPIDKIYNISTEVRTKTVENVTGQTKDAQWVKISMDIKYKVSETNAFRVFKQFKTLSVVDDNLITPLVQRSIEEVTTKYNVIDILGEKRNQVYTEIEVAVKERLSQSGIEFFSLVLMDTDAGQAIESAIEKEAVAKKEVETALQAQEKARVEANTKVIQAQANAEVQVINATAEAEVRIISANAESEANTKISKSLTPEILKKMEMEARLKFGWIEITGAQAQILIGK